MKNKNVEEFFLDFLPREEGVPMSRCALFLSNYYKEIEDPEAFKSEHFNNQRERAMAMFPGIPVRALDLMDVKFNRHQISDHGETGNEEYTETLALTMEGTAYEPYTVQKWWAS